ncbi:MAG: hypothetical protein MI974_17310 [Chitinophagales bacterium]|nr:hypothetical protein [Chitinophagales bacterium]
MEKVFICHTNDPFHQFNGKPVWGTNRIKVIEGIKKIATQFDLEVESIQEKDTVVVDKLTGEGVVCCMDAEIIKEARVYAFLTNRQFKFVKNITELINVPNLEILVSLLKDIDLALVKALYERSSVCEFAPGIIFGYNKKELDANVFIKAVALYGHAVESVQRFDFFASLLFDKQEKGKHIIGGQLLELDCLKALLSEKKDLLVIKSHSDGIDGRLGKGILCPLNETYYEEATGHSVNLKEVPTCVASAYCHRLQCSLEEVKANPRLISPLNISARILFYNTCFGIPVNSKLVALKWGYARELFNNPNIGVLITTWKPIAPNDSYVLQVAHELEKGEPVGQVVAQFNQRKDKTNSNTIYGIFGDPLIKLQFKQKSEDFNFPLFHNYTDNKQDNTKVKLWHNRLSFWDAFFKIQLLKREKQYLHEGGMDDTLYEKASDCLSQIQDCNLKLLLGEKLSETIIMSLQIQIIDYIFHLGPQPYRDWCNLCSHRLLLPEESNCNYCQSDIEIFEFRFRNDDIYLPRYVHICPVCGISADRSFHMKNEFSMFFPGESKIEIHGLDRLETSKNAAIMLQYPNKENNQCWIIDDELSPIEVFEITDSIFDKGSVYCSLITLDNFELNITGIPIRAEYFRRDINQN